MSCLNVGNLPNFRENRLFAAIEKFLSEMNHSNINSLNNKLVKNRLNIFHTISLPINPGCSPNGLSFFEKGSIRQWKDDVSCDKHEACYGWLFYFLLYFLSLFIHRQIGRRHIILHERIWGTVTTNYIEIQTRMDEKQEWTGNSIQIDLYLVNIKYFCQKLTTRINNLKASYQY